MFQVRWVLFADEWLHSSQQRVIEGLFYLQTDVGNFPCSTWRTLPAIELSYLMSTMAGLPEHSGKKATVPLGLKGSYYCVLQMSGDLCSLSFLRSYVPAPLEKLPPIVYPYQECCRILQVAGQSLLDEYVKQGIGTHIEIEALQKGLQALQSRGESWQ